MEQRFQEAAQKGNIEELNDLIRSNGLILEEMALEGAGHTPLHIVCVAGHLGFVQEVLKLMPKVTEKVNADGFSPLHIAAARGDLEIAGELLRVCPNLCSVKGRERRIPLHYAVVNGELNVMEMLLSTSPESVEETTTREETALHLAVKNNRFDAVVVLVEHLKKYKKENVINWKDHQGNTVLHLAAASKNFEVVKFMLRGLDLKYEVQEVNALNESGLTPLDVLTLSQRGARDREMREILARAGARHGRGRSNTPASSVVLGNEDSIKEDNSHLSDRKPVSNAHQWTTGHTPLGNSNKENESLADRRNALLVVAALITSATYQAVLQPPSYKAQVDDSHKGGIVVYILFMSFNTFGFLASFQTIISLVKDLPVRVPLRLSMYSMFVTYVTFMGCAPFMSMDKELALKNKALVFILPVTISFILLLTQKWSAPIIDRSMDSIIEILGNTYSLGANPTRKDQTESC